MRDEKTGIGMSALRGAAIFVCFIAISSLTSFVIRLFTAMGQELLSDLPNYMIHILCTVGAILIFYSLELAFSTADKYRISDFLERDDKSVSLISEAGRIFTNFKTLSETVTTHLLIAISASLGAFPQIGGMFFERMPEAGWFPMLTLTPVCLMCSIIAKYEAARHWKKLYQENNIEKVQAPSWIILRMLTIICLYPTVFPLSPILVYMIYTLCAILVQLTVVLTTIGAIIALIALIFIIWGASVLVGVLKRKKFLKKLKMVAADNGYSLCDLTYPYRSFATSKNHCSFLLILDGKAYSCIMISTLRKGTPLVFTSENDAHFLHRLGTKEHGITMRHSIEFFHPYGDEKIVIVNPSPKRVYASERGSQRVVYCSDRIWGFTVHDAESFLGAVERRCLDKNSAVSGK